MKVVVSLFLLLLFNSFGICQASDKDSDECVVSVKTYTNVKSLNDEDDRIETKIIGKFELTGITEGKFEEKAFRIPGSKLFVFANVGYDDNLYLDDKNFDAINLTLAVSPTKKLSLSSSLSVATTQTTYYENFKTINLVTLAHYKNKWFDVSMQCSEKQRAK